MTFRHIEHSILELMLKINNISKIMKNKVKSQSARILFYIFFWSLIVFNTNKVYAEEKTDTAEKTKWSLVFLLSLGPTNSWFFSGLNKERDKVILDREISKLYKIKRGMFVLWEFQCGYRTLPWLENQGFINLCCNVLENMYLSLIPEGKRNKFTGSLDLNIGTNVLFYQGNFFELIGLGIRTSFPFNYWDDYFQLMPVLKLGFGYKFDFGLILRLATNIPFGISGLKEKYNKILTEIPNEEDEKTEKMGEFGSNISHNILEFSIGFDYGVLLDKKNNISHLTKQFWIPSLNSVYM